jgi:hypothetical protein
MGIKNKNPNQPHVPWSGRLKNNNPPCDLALLPRCNAKAKSTGVQCKQPAMKNGKCHWHGGKSTGAPLGNMNSFKHGMYTKESLERRKNIRQLLKTCREALNNV